MGDVPPGARRADPRLEYMLVLGVAMLGLLVGFLSPVAFGIVLPLTE